MKTNAFLWVRRSLRASAWLVVLLGGSRAVLGDGLVLGNLVWRDDGDGIRQPEEPGIGGVGLSLFRDGGDAGRDGSDEYLGGGTTDAAGGYAFDGLAAGDYVVEVGAWNFNAGGALYGLMSSPGRAEPENSIDDDDDGVDSSMPVNWGISSGRLTLSDEQEPTTDGDDANGNQTLDFGFWSPPEPPILVLGGRVWRDLNADGRLDPEESGVAGVGVSIIQVFEDGSEIHQGGAGTDADGNYRFYGRPAGRYLVQVDNWNFGEGSTLANLVSSPGAADADDNLTGDDNGRDTPLAIHVGLRSHALTLSHGDEPGADLDGDDANGNLTVDFGLIPALTLGDRVFLDADQDGSFREGDSGLESVLLYLFSDQNQSGRLDDGDWHLASTTSAEEGRYVFGGLAPGDYLIWVANENFAVGGALFGLATCPVDEVDPNAEGDHNDNGLVRYPHGITSAALTLEAGGEPVSEDGDPNTNLTLDFGFQAGRLLTLGNQVFGDLNNNGVFEPELGETGIAGVEVRLYRDTEESNSVSARDQLMGSVVTDADGRFEFTGLAPTDGQPPYLLAIPAVNFQSGGALEGWITSEPVFGQGHDGWRDGHDHGWNNGTEWGISTWQLHVNPGALPVNDDGDPNTDLTVDFGFTPELRIGNRLWADLNRNGHRDAGEPGIPGVEVHLVRDNGDGVLSEEDSVIQGTGTDTGGHYEFRGLTLGDYFVVIPPGNFEVGRALSNRQFRSGSAGPDPVDDVDNDDNGILQTVLAGERVVSGRIELTVGGEPTSEDGNPNTNLTVDFGFVQGPLPSIGNLVWNDGDNDGRYEPLGADGVTGTADDESGIGGVGVSLYRDDGDGIPNSGPDEGAMWTVTGPDGLYQFTGVSPGQYFIRIEYGSFAVGQPLFGFVSSTGVADPGNGVDHDDNGTDEEFPLHRAVHSPVFTVAEDGTPTEDGLPTDDGDDEFGDQTLDFGFHSPAEPPVLSLGGALWRDADGDGQRDEGEMPAPEVGLTLMRIQPDGSDYWVQGGGTDKQGNYRFSGLPAGTYRVVVWNWNFVPGGPLEGLFSFPGAADADLNVVGDDNGVDAVDPANQNIYSRRLTLAHGTEPDVSVTGDPGNGNHTLDFGFLELPGGPRLSLGGRVFRDVGNDGGMEGPDTGIPSAFVALWIDNGDGELGTGDVHVGSVPSTDADGTYRFDHLPPADYLIQMYSGQFFPGGPLAGLRSSLSDQVPEPVVDPDDDVAGDDNGFESAGFGEFFMVITRAVSLRDETEPTGEDGDPNTNLTVDLGYYEGPTLELSGTVFRDEDADGQQDAGEAGFEGVTVEFWLDHNGDGVPSDGDGHFLNAYTDAGGTYRMGPLVPGDYLVVLRYHNFMPGRPLNGWRSSLSDSSPEPQIDPNTDVDSDDNGFEFGGWGRAFFGVGTGRVTLAYGAEPDAAVDGDGPHANATVDFGFVAGPTGRVGNLVFRDANNNGVREGEEVGLEHVHVKLFYDNGDGELGDGDEDLGVDVYTDATGAYTLPGLPEGRYLVVLPWDNWWPGRALNGLRSSRSDETPEPAVDLEVDRTEDDDNGQERTLSWWPSVQVASRAFTVAPGAVRPDVDFGFYAGATLELAGTVFRDEDNSGTRDAGEAALPEVAVQLFQDNGDGVFHHGDWHIGDATTDATGNYRFAGLMPGHYVVAIRRDNHFYGRALTNLRTSTGNDPAPDPDDDVAGDDNGVEVAAFDDPQFGVASLPITLEFGLEPGLAEDGDGPDSNATLDFGFEPVVGTTFVVTDAGDGDDGVCDGHCTLREAIQAANAHPGTDTITIAIGEGGVQTIVVGSALPAFIEPVVLDATTQPGYAGMPLIELRGDAAGPGAAGLLVDAGSSVVRGFVINRFDHGGIHLRGGSGNLVQGNFIGTDPSGTTTTGGIVSEYGGVYVVNSHGNQIGGRTAATRNLISGLDIGIRVENGRHNVIEGNRVGTDVTGTLALGNSGRAGIWVLGGGQNRIGGAAPGAGNLVSGNNTGVDVWYGAGVLIEGSEGTVVEGNLIGTDVTGEVALGNAIGLIANGRGVRVGGLEEGSGNVISGNRYQGVNLGGECRLMGNFIGTDRTGTRPLGNASVGVGLWGVRNLVGGPTPAERNVISANGDDGIVICGGSGSGEHVIQGNFIGTDVTGTVRLGNGANGWGPGIRTCGENTFNVIGGLEPGAGNLIAGNNGSQVDLRSSDNQVLGNRIGTDVTGTHSLLAASGGVGVFETAERNLIAGNLISGVDRAIYLAGSGVRATRVLGNRIGTNADGTGPLPNMVGVDVYDSPDNVIGGTGAGAANTIAFSQAYGVGVSGAAAVNNAIRGNTIHDNGSLPGDWLGLDLMHGPPVTPNDPGDADEGPNHVQNHPVLLQAAASAGLLAADGWLNSTAHTSFAIDLYANPACDPTGHGEGKRHLGSVDITTDAAGDGHFHVNLPVVVVPGEFITATATDPAGNTSEFSACREVVAEGPPVIREVATRGAADQLAVFFSETVSEATATDPANYTVSCGLNVVSATLLEDGRTALLKLSGPVPATGCALTVNGVQDLAEPANTIAANTQAEIFQALGVITRREYRHVPYGQVVDLVNHPRFPNQPSVVDYATTFESPADQGDNYGVQMLGYVHPPVTGEYVFYLSADETAELYLSPDETPRNKQLIAVEVGPNPPYQWTEGNRTANISAPVWLEAGRRYYLEALMKEGGGSDHLAVAWQAPGEPVPANGSSPLAGAFLEAWVEPDVTTAPFVGLGGLVFRDADNNGRYDPPVDTSIPGVTVELWMDQNPDNVLHHGDWYVSQTLTDADGRYRFEGLHPGGYLAVINQGEHFYGRPLTGLRTSTGNDPAPDPDNDLTGEDHGYEAAFFDGQVGERIATRALTLTAGGEPDAAADGDGPSGNQTLDFGFQPVTGTTFIVNATDDADDGACDGKHCSLREAIHAANAHPGKDTIAFAIRGAGPHTIQPGSWLPDLYETVIVDATTQPGYDGAPLIEVDGQLAGDGVIGLRFYGGFSEVRGLCVHGFKGGGLHLAYGSQNTVAACFIGTDVTGTGATLPFQGGYYFAGIILDSPESVIGGTQAADRNLISGYDTGVWVRSSDNRIAGNFIGTDVSGTFAVGNGGGVYLESGDRNEVGGMEPAARNIISGNQVGVGFGNGSHNRVLGNFIGTDRAGVGPLPNETGLTLYGSGGQVIGAPGAGNLIAANRNTNLDIRSGDNRIQANFIGTDATGARALGTTQGGIYFADNASGNVVGGAEPGQGNLISGHLGVAIQVGGPFGQHQFLGNRVGTDLTGTLPLPNGAGIVLSESPANRVGGTGSGEANLIAFNRGSGVIVSGDTAIGNVIRGNSIHANGDADAGLPGVDLAYGPLLTPNDDGDGDEGPNRVQNYPDLLFASASGTGLVVEGTLNSLPGTTFTLDFYASPACDPSGYGEGKRHLGSSEATTDGSGNAWFLVNLSVTVLPGHVLTATATDPAGNTSEFSRCFSVLDEAPPTVVVVTSLGSADRLTVVFSESLDPTTANDPARYQLTCGTVTAAHLGADRRTVILSYTGALMPGCTLTVNGVTDLAGVPVAADTPALVLNTQGALSRYVYLNVGGWRIADLKAEPRFPDQPDVTTDEPALEAPTDFADDYGQKLAGYLTAPVTGDYVFHLASDDGGEFYLSPDTDPAHKALVAQVSYWILQPRAWNDGVIHVPADQVLTPGTLFIEAEDFDFDGGQFVTDKAIGITGEYSGDVYAGRGSAADEGIDWHDTSADVPEAQNYRAFTGIETLPISRPEDLDRGSFEVSVNHKLGWNDAGEWHNYTRDFSDVAGAYWVVARLSSGAGPIAAELAQVTAGRGTSEQSTAKLGEFRSPPPGNPNGWDHFVFVPLTGEDGQPVRVSLEGLTTLRFTTLPGNHDFDYVAFVPAGTEAWVARPENQSAPIALVAGQRYYVEAIMKEGGGGDHLAVTWQMPGAPAPRNGDPPIPGAYLSSEAVAVITRQPVDQTVFAGEPATFSVEVRGALPISIQWYRDGEPIVGATESSYTLPAVSLLEDDGAVFEVWVANSLGTEISQEALLTVMSVTPVLEGLVPPQAAANGPDFTLVVSGQGFSSGAIVYWNGAPRVTTYRSPFELEAAVSAEDLATTASLWTVPVTVVGPNGAASQPLPFTLFNDSQVTEAASAIAMPGGATMVSTLPETAGEAGVAAAAANHDPLSDPLLVTVGTYAANPTGTTTFDVGGGFVDLQVTGADPSDRVQAYFYYPTTLTGRTEEKLRLLYFDGTRWAQVRSDGPSLPVKHTADAPTYGGYFDVTFSDTSVPRVTELSGTVFTFTESTPEITALSGPTGPLPLGSPATLAVEFVAVGTPDSHTVRFDWDDGTATTLTPVEDGFASATHVYDAAGVYTVRVQVTDAEGDAAVAPFEYVVVYDPVGGFVTGGGWILSPPGAYQLLPSVSGKATFGFVSKYKKGAQIPSGNTEFQFVAAELCFTSTAYQWLVVTGPKAQYKGVGVINEQGDYGFLLTAVDGQINGGGGVDRLRLKIWERATGVVVYDNAPSVSDDLDGSNSQPLGGGSVVIHR